MPTILTVHGTNASGPEAGDSWWQKGSPFEKHLRQLLEADVGEFAFQPFIWDGANSEKSRRAAGRLLFEEMWALEDQGEPYSLIGHSHGGSVIAGALVESAVKKKPLNNMNKWITIGTPFIQTERKKFLFSRLGHFGKIIFIALISTFIAMSSTEIVRFFNSLVEDNSSEFRLVASDALWWLAKTVLPFIMFYIILLATQNNASKMYGSRAKSFIRSQYCPRWFSIWHADDEAIQVLSNVKNLRLDIFSITFAISFINLISIFVLPVCLFITIYSPNISVYIFDIINNAYYHDAYPEQRFSEDGKNALHNAAFLISFLIDLSESIIEYISGIESYPISLDSEIYNLFSNAIVPSLLVLAVSLAVYFAFDLLARIASYVLSCLLNPLTRGQIQSAAFGSDTKMDFGVNAQEWPMWFDSGYPPISEPVSGELRRDSDQAAEQAVPKFRNAIGKLAAFTPEDDMSDFLSDYLTWKELIHTSYFDNLHLRKLVAFALTKMEGTRATEAFQQDPDYALVASWYSQLSDSSTPLRRENDHS